MTKRETVLAGYHQAVARGDATTVIATYSIVGGEMETLDTPNNPAMSAAPRVSKALIAASESVKEAVTKYVEESPSSSTLTDECETLSTFA